MLNRPLGSSSLCLRWRESLCFIITFKVTQHTVQIILSAVFTPNSITGLNLEPSVAAGPYKCEWNLLLKTTNWLSVAISLLCKHLSIFFDGAILQPLPINKALLEDMGPSWASSCLLSAGISLQPSITLERNPCHLGLLLTPFFPFNLSLKQLLIRRRQRAVLLSKATLCTLR